MSLVTIFKPEPKLGVRFAWSSWGTDGSLLFSSRFTVHGSPEIHESILELGSKRLKLSS